MQLKQEKEKTRFSQIVAKLDAYSPLKTLSRGYSITQKDGKVVKTQAELESGDMVELRFIDGVKQAEIQ